MVEEEHSPATPLIPAMALVMLGELHRLQVQVAARGLADFPHYMALVSEFPPG